MTENKTNNETKSTGNGLVMKVMENMASMKVTVVCLALLAVLVVWGTVYQSGYGLYQAQHKFFYSWVFMIYDVIPFPGTVMVLFVLFVNLICSFVLRMTFRLLNIGNIITHLGLMLMLMGGFFSLYFSQESVLSLKEGESSSWSSSYHDWELALWEQKGGDREVYAMDTKKADSGDTFSFQGLGFRLAVSEYYSNCSAHTGNTGQNVINGSGIGLLKGKAMDPKMEANMPGMVFDIQLPDQAGAGGSSARVLVYGGESRTTGVSMNGRTYGFKLRKKKFPLPLQVELIDFKMKTHPNSTMAASYESKVKISGEEMVEREVVVSMNQPLRHDDYTFFQSSYFIEQNGTEHSIFAVVKNSGRLIPYITSFAIFIGLMIHFLVMMFQRKKKNGGDADAKAGKEA
ncbi:MAG: cytochrome c biogenesis protein ResB [bacterium]|nr:cytochrome c biogenesis protein ResB [bacterium]